ncbi:MAG: hypothetical protein ACYC1F_04485 [Gallionellaceae bacterium]
MTEIFSWFSSNATGLGIFGAAIAFSWSVFQFILERRRESHEKQFEAFHKLVKELVQPGQDGYLWIDRQAAIIFELRHFPRYYEFTERMLEGLKMKWEADSEFKWPRLIEEVNLTLNLISESNIKQSKQLH